MDLDRHVRMFARVHARPMCQENAQATPDEEGAMSHDRQGTNRAATGERQVVAATRWFFFLRFNTGDS